MLSDASDMVAGSAGDAASALADRAAEGATKLAEQGGSLPDAAASTSQAAPGAIEAAGERSSCNPSIRTPAHPGLLFTDQAARGAGMCFNIANLSFACATHMDPSSAAWTNLLCGIHH